MAKVVQITAENFEAEVIQASETRAVAILFSSAEYPDCAPYSQLLGQLSTSMDFTLGVVSCDDRENMRLIQMFRVQSVPEIHMVDKGQIADVIQGVLPEADLKKRLEKFFVSDEQRFQMALEDAIAQKNFDEALPMLDEALAKNPNDKKLQLLWAKASLGLGDTAKAKEILNTTRGLGRGAGIVSAPVGLSPSREDFEKKVNALQQQNRESEKGSDDIAKEISRTATQGYRAYDNEDQAALTKACEELDQIQELLKPEQKQEDRPPMWMVCAYFSQQILDVISKYQQDRTLPPAARKQFDRYVRDDIRSCQDIQSGCRLMPEEKDCAPYLQTIREMYPRWDQCSKLMNDTGLPGMP